MEVWKISGKCDDRNSIIVDLKTSGSFEVWTCSIKCGKNSREDERESFKFNEYSHRAGYKLLKTSCNADNLGFENIKTNKPTSARGRHFEEQQFKQIIETKYALL